MPGFEERKFWPVLEGVGITGWNEWQWFAQKIMNNSPQGSSLVEGTSKIGRALFNAWPSIGMLIVFWIEMSLQVADLEKFRFLDSSLGAEPPWYEIRRDFSEGIYALGALLASLALAAIGWKRFRDSAEMVVWMSILWKGGAILRAIVIFLYCPRFFDRSAAVSHWPTLDSYSRDVIFDVTQWVGPLMGCCLAGAFAHFRKAGQSAHETSCAQTPNTIKEWVLSKEFGRFFLSRLLLVVVIAVPLIVYRVISILFPGMNCSTPYFIASIAWLIGVTFVMFAREAKRRKRKGDEACADCL